MIIDDYYNTIKQAQDARNKLDTVCRKVFNQFLQMRYENSNQAIKKIVVHRKQIHDDYIEFMADVTVEKKNKSHTNNSKRHTKKLSENFFIHRSVIEEYESNNKIVNKTFKSHNNRNKLFWNALEEKVKICSSTKLQLKDKHDT